MALERLYAAWREAYVSSPEAQRHSRDEGSCVFCSLSEEEPSIESGVLWRDPLTFVTLNAFPYGSGHLLVLPRRHVGGVSELSDEEYVSFSMALRRTVRALESAYSADGMNIGMNLGQAAGAGIPKHLHAHALPRWSGDTNFMTAIGETRVLPESLETTWTKVFSHLSVPHAG
ncbi:MAG: HIT domain-containing protein [Acidimicrobiaceae bacterium]|nr:HIT domain-containing protein [Acidimicrobiaceae bacterium]